MASLQHTFLEYPIYFIPFCCLCLVVLSFILLNQQLGIYANIISTSVLLFITSYLLLLYLILFKSLNFYQILYIGDWLKIGGTIVKFSFYIDTISLSFSGLTTNIGFFAVTYAFGYFRGEPNVNRLLTLIQLFIISMSILVLARNLILLFLGWELIGFTSFLLINFWTLKIASLKSSLKAFYFNRWSDSFLLIFIVLIFYSCQTLEIDLINHLIIYNLSGLLEGFLGYISYDCTNYYSERIIENYSIDFILIFLIMASNIKSAQFITHLWLPDSMEAPVPASALIHSATLVSAGIYLILRFESLICLSNYASQFILFWGCVTSVYGGLVAAGQMDLKRILAYSTISHCGNMMVLASSGLGDFTILYLYVHGYFKAISFLCVGNIIRFYKNNQDLRKMGMSAFYLPSDSLLISISLLNLGGLPFTFGYYVKHTLFLVPTSNAEYFLLILISLLILTTLTGLIYSFKIIQNVIFSYKKGAKVVYRSAESLNLISKFRTSAPFFLNYLIILSIITSFMVILILILQVNISGNGVLDLTSVIRNNSTLNHGSLINILNGLLLLNLTLILIDYWLNSLWTRQLPRMKGNYILYLYIIPSLVFIELIDVFWTFWSSLLECIWYYISKLHKFLIWLCRGDVKDAQFIELWVICFFLIWYAENYCHPQPRPSVKDFILGMEYLNGLYKDWKKTKTKN